MEWKWKGDRLEEVREVTYLEYRMSKNGGRETIVRDSIRRGVVLMRKVWRLGKRVFGRNWEKRLWLFDTLVWTVMSYGVEI